MPVKDANLHGNAPDESPVVLLIIDTINDLEYEGGDDLLKQALPMAEKIAGLKDRARSLGIPVVYVNDNFGKWRSDFNNLVQHCLEGGVLGQPIAELLKPDSDDYFVLKPKNSGFFSTTLEMLLHHLRARHLILTGMAGNNCVLFTAADAYQRGFELITPSDCIASSDPEDNRQALELMSKVLNANTGVSDDLDLDAMLAD